MLKINSYNKKLKLLELMRDKDFILKSSNSKQKTAALVKITVEILKQENK